MPIDEDRLSSASWFEDGAGEQIEDSHEPSAPIEHVRKRMLRRTRRSGEARR
jgi:hypothetical protein